MENASLAETFSKPTGYAGLGVRREFGHPSRHSALSGQGSLRLYFSSDLAALGSDPLVDDCASQPS